MATKCKKCGCAFRKGEKRHLVSEYADGLESGSEICGDPLCLGNYLAALERKADRDYDVRRARRHLSPLIGFAARRYLK